MSVIGEAFVAITPLGTGFASKVEAQVAASGFAGKVEKQMASAGVLGGNAFTRKIQGALSAAGISGGAALGAGITLGAVAGLAKIGEEFQKVEHQIAQETGATGASLTKLADTVTRSFRQVPASLHDTATAVDELFRRGVPLGPQLDALAKQELFLAKVTKEDLGATVEATTGLMQKFNVPIADQSRELDVLFKAYQHSGKSLFELTSTLQKAGGVLQSFGFSLDKSAALLSALEKASVNLAPAMAGMRLAFGKIVSEGGDPQRVLANLIKEFTDGTPKTKAMADAIQLFGKRSGAELSIAISKGKFDVDALLKSITNGRDGIVATGLATLTLGDQLKLFANNAQADLSKLGTNVLQGLERTFADVGPPILSLVSSLGRLAEAATPAALAFLPLVNAVRAIGPVVSVLAAGVDVLAHGLDLIPGPALAVTVGLGAILFASDALIARLTVLAARMVFVAAEFALAHPVLAAFVAVVATVGIVSKLAASQVDPAIKEAKAFGDAAFDATSKTTAFREGVKSTGAAFASFLKDQAAAGKLSTDVSKALIDAGSNVKKLSGAVTGTNAAWQKYRDSVVAAASAHDEHRTASEGDSLQIRVLGLHLDDQREAFQKANSAALAQRVILGTLTLKQGEYLAKIHTSKDGTVDYGAAVDDLNRRLSRSARVHDEVVLAADSTATVEKKLTDQLAAGSITDAEATSKLKALGLTGTAVAKELATLKDSAVALNQETDRIASTTVPATSAYGELTRQIALGTITQHDAVAQLHAMGFSLEGAGTAFSNLQSQVKSFVDGAVGQLPTVGKAISDFAQQITSDEQQLASDKQTAVDLRTKLDEAIAKSGAATQQKLATINLTIAQDQVKIGQGSVTTTDKLQRDLLRRSQIIAGSGKASDDLRTEIEKNNAAIIADNKKLADDNNPNRFTQNLLDNAVKIVAFTANLNKLVHDGLPLLAAELAKQGPDAAAGLAAGLAGSPAKAIIAEKAVELGKTASDNFRTFLEKNAPELIGTGAKQGLVVGKAIADGITKELLHNFPFLRQIGITTGEEVLGGAKESAGKSSVTDPIVAQARLHIPEFRGLGVPIGTNLMDGTKAGIAGRTDVLDGLAAQVAAGSGALRGAGVGLGNALDEGVSTGIILNQFKVGDAIVTMTAYGTQVAANQWRIKSPSQVFAAIGREVPAGVAAGITSNLGVIGVALSGIHASSQTVLRQLAQDGFNVGTASAAGIAEGIRSQFDNVGNAMLAVTQHGIAVARGAWKVTSPSKVFTEIGSQVGAGLAEGIASSAASVGSAADRLANATTASVRSALAGVTFDPTVEPVITPKVAQPVVPPIPEQTFAGRVDAVSVPSVPSLSLTGVLGPVAPPPVPPVIVSAALGPVAPPIVSPVTIPATLRVPPEPVTVRGHIAADVLPVAPVKVDALVNARLGPVASPHVSPVVIAASVRVPADPVHVEGSLAVSVPPIAPVSLDAVVRPPVIAPVVVPASFGPLPTPNAPNVLVHGSFAPLTPPHLDPVTLSVSVPRIPPQQIDGVVEARVPPIRSVVVPATLGPLPTPSVAPVTVPADLGPIVQPRLDPVVIQASVTQPEAPVIAPVVVPASLSHVEVPRIAPVVAPVVVPPIAPVTVTASLSSLVVPPLPRAVVTVAPLDVPPIAPVVVPTSLSQVAPPVISPVTISATVEPKVQPIDATPLGRRLGDTVAAGISDGLAATAISDQLSRAAQVAGASASSSFTQAGTLLASDLSSSLLTGLDQRSGETLSEWRRRLDALFGQRSGESISEWHRRIADGFRKSFQQMGGDVEELRRFLLALGGAKVAPTLDLAKFDQTTGAASQRFSDWLTRLNQLVPQRSGEALNEWSGRIQDFFAQRSGETISEWHRRLREIVGDSQKSIGQIGDPASALTNKLRGAFDSLTDPASTAKFVTFAAGLVTPFTASFEKIAVSADELQKVLDGLTAQHSAKASELSNELLDKLVAQKLLVPKFAPPAPPSKVTFTEAAQSVQETNPVNRANARREVARQAGPFDGATIQFPDKTDPLHLASALAWAIETGQLPSEH